MAGPPPPKDPRRRPDPPPKIIIRRPGPPPAPDPGRGQAPAPPPKTQRFEGKPGQIKLLWWSVSIQGLIYLGAGFAVLIAAIIVSWMAVANLGLKSNFSDGLRLHDGGRPAAAARQLTDALEWKPDHHWAREMRAKILTEAEEFGAASKEYQYLSRQPRHAVAASAGLGAIALRRADRAKTSQEAVALANKAIEYYSRAGGMPEAGIGRALATLLIGIRTDDRAKLIEARRSFETVLANLDASRASRSGLLDLYSGYGLCLGLLVEKAEAAYGYSWLASSFEPKWEAPKRNGVMTLARAYWESPPTLEAFAAQRAEAEERVRAARNVAHYTNVFPRLKRAADLLAVGVSRMYLRNREFDRFASTMNSLTVRDSDPGFAKKLRASILSNEFDPSDMTLDPGSVERYYVTAFNDVASDRNLTTTEDIRLRALMYNNVAVCYEYIFVRRSTPGDWKRPITALHKALELDPGCRPALVNLVMILYRQAETLPPGTAREAALAPARKALLSAGQKLQVKGEDDPALKRLMRARKLVEER